MGFRISVVSLEERSMPAICQQQEEEKDNKKYQISRFGTTKSSIQTSFSLLLKFSSRKKVEK